MIGPCCYCDGSREPLNKPSYTSRLASGRLFSDQVMANSPPDQPHRTMSFRRTVSMKIFSTVNTASDREAVEIYKQHHRWCPVIFPWKWHYKLWWSLTVFAALFAL